MPLQLPDFYKMWAASPCDTDSATVKKFIGGNVDADYIKNTCAIRLSAALNGAGARVPVTMRIGINKKTKAPLMLETVSGRDGKRYVLKVAHLDAYLRKVYGNPSVVWKNPKPEKPVPNQPHRPVRPKDIPAEIKGKRGIIVFKVFGWDDATGHFDLWNDDRPAYLEYFYNAVEVGLWADDRKMSTS